MNDELDFVRLPKAELERLQGRLNKLGQEKSTLQLVNTLMQGLGAQTGLENAAERIIRLLGDHLGGRNIVIYYRVNQELRHLDLYGQRGVTHGVLDDVIGKVLQGHDSIEESRDFDDTAMQTSEFTRSSYLALPLRVGDRVVGALKMEGMLLSGLELTESLGPFFNYAALVLSHEIEIQSRLAEAYVRLEETRRAEAELKRLTLRNEAILNSAGEGIYGTDLEGKILFLNQAAQEMLGWSASEVIGRSSHQLFHHTWADGRPYPLQECPLHASLSQGGSRCGWDEIFFWNRDGRKLPVELVITPLVVNGAVMGAVVIFRDVTEQRRAEEEIRQFHQDLETRVLQRTAELKDSQAALMNLVEDLNEKSTELVAVNERLQDLDRLKSMFIASMSHELRTPLNSIIGFSSILINEWAGPLTGEQKDNLASVLRSGKHLLALINDVIDVTRIEAGKVESTLEDFDLHELVTEAVTSLSKDIADRGLALSVAVNHLTVRTDRRRLLQCLLNLLSNAAKFTEQGSITVSAECSGGAVDIAVSDTGIGIGVEDQGKLFGSFVRLDSPLRTKILGTGLGLYLTKKLVTEVLQGDISCTSVLGRGSRFVVRIPALREAK